MKKLNFSSGIFSRILLLIGCSVLFSIYSCHVEDYDEFKSIRFSVSGCGKELKIDGSGKLNISADGGTISLTPANDIAAGTMRESQVEIYADYSYDPDLKDEIYKSLLWRFRHSDNYNEKVFASEWCVVTYKYERSGKISEVILDIAPNRYGTPIYILFYAGNAFYSGSLYITQEGQPF